MSRDVSSAGSGWSRTQIGMILFMLTEGLFFTLLIFAYLYFAGSSSEARHLDVPRTGLFSLFLFSSSLTVWRAESSLRKSRLRRRSAWLLLTLGLGFLFLVGQGIEWAQLIGEGRTISRDLFGTAFFTLTGFHGLHVFVGLGLLAALFGLGSRGALNGALAEEATKVVSWYWHFVDAVWVVIFSVVYLGAFFQ